MKTQLWQYGFMMVFNSNKIATCFGQQRPPSGYYNFAQRASKSIIYMPILQGDAEISPSLRVTVSLFSGKSIMVNDWQDVSLWVGIGGGGRQFGGRDNKLCCLWYSIGLGVRGLLVSMFDVFWVLFGVVVNSVVSWLQDSPFYSQVRSSWHTVYRFSVTKDHHTRIVNIQTRNKSQAG